MVLKMEMVTTLPEELFLMQTVGGTRRLTRPMWRGWR